VGLITKEVLIGLGGSNIKWFEEKGYEIPRVKDNFYRLVVPRDTKILVNVDDLPNNSTAIYVNVECDDCGKSLENILWQAYKRSVKENGKYYCIKCASKLYGAGIQNKLTEKEIRKIIDEILGENWEIAKIKTNKKTYVELVDPEGYKYSSVNIQVIKKSGTSKFSTTNKYTKDNINHWLKLNNISFYLINEYKKSHNKIEFKCLECNNLIKRSWDDIQQGNISCPMCSDGISYPEKFGLNLFNQLGVNYNYNSKLIKSKNKRYDFTCEDLKIIVETHGLQHYEDCFNNLGGRTLEEEIKNDRCKKELAEHNGYKYIEIDCRKSEMEWIKNSILNSELAQTFNLSDIDWLKCHEFACNSFVKTVSELWNNGIKNTKRIAEIIKLSKPTIIKYLKQGVTLGICNYTIETSIKEGYELRKKYNKSIVQLTISGKYIREFESAKEVNKQIGIQNVNICKCCKGERKTAGGFKWMYKSDYEEMIRVNEIAI